LRTNVKPSLPGKLMMRVLGVFAKYWAAGLVKTRLAETIGPAAAAEFYRLMLDVILRRMRQAPAQSHVVAYSPPTAADAFAELAPEWQSTPQVAGDLGVRMKSFVAEQFSQGASKVVLIGSDCLDVTPDLICQAWELLDEVPVVWGPAVDGGYYLVGLSSPTLPVFEGIAWSTDQVLRQSRQRVLTAGGRDALLPELADLDDWDSLQSWLASHPHTETPELRDLVQKMQTLRPHRA